MADRITPHSDSPASLPAGNVLAPIPSGIAGEYFQALHAGRGARIERIVSGGHAGPSDHWYDEPEDEWVMVVQGAGTLEFADASRRTMSAGDWLLLPAHCRHRVVETSADAVWLAVYLAP